METVDYVSLRLVMLYLVEQKLAIRLVVWLGSTNI